MSSVYVWVYGALAVAAAVLFVRYKINERRVREQERVMEAALARAVEREEKRRRARATRSYDETSMYPSREQLTRAREHVVKAKAARTPTDLKPVRRTMDLSPDVPYHLPSFVPYDPPAPAPTPYSSGGGGDFAGGGGGSSWSSGDSGGSTGTD